MTNRMFLFLAHSASWLMLGMLAWGVLRAKSGLEVDRILLRTLEVTWATTISSLNQYDDAIIAGSWDQVRKHNSDIDDELFRQVQYARRIVDSVNLLLSVVAQNTTIEPSPDLLPPQGLWDNLVHMAPPNFYSFSKKTFDPGILVYTSADIAFYQRQWHAADAPGRRTLLRSLQLRNMLALRSLRDYHIAILGDTYDGCDSFDLLLIPDPYPAVTRQTVRLNFFLSPVGRGEQISPTQTRFWVNDRQVSATNRKFLFETTFDQAGPQHFLLRAEIHNPVTGETKTYERDYILNVRPKN